MLLLTPLLLGLAGWLVYGLALKPVQMGQIQFLGQLHQQVAVRGQQGKQDKQVVLALLVVLVVAVTAHLILLLVMQAHHLKGMQEEMEAPAAQDRVGVAVARGALVMLGLFLLKPEVLEVLASNLLLMAVPPLEQGVAVAEQIAELLGLEVLEEVVLAAKTINCQLMA
jgi:hypothetical protein